MPSNGSGENQSRSSFINKAHTETCASSAQVPRLPRGDRGCGGAPADAIDHTGVGGGHVGTEEFREVAATPALVVAPDRLRNHVRPLALDCRQMVVEQF